MSYQASRLSNSVQLIDYYQFNEIVCEVICSNLDINTMFYGVKGVENPWVDILVNPMHYPCLHCKCMETAQRNYNYRYKVYNVNFLICIFT